MILRSSNFSVVSLFQAMNNFLISLLLLVARASQSIIFLLILSIIDWVRCQSRGFNFLLQDLLLIDFQFSFNLFLIYSWYSLELIKFQSVIWIHKSTYNFIVIIFSNVIIIPITFESNLIIILMIQVFSSSFFIS